MQFEIWNFDGLVAISELIKNEEENRKEKKRRVDLFPFYFLIVLRVLRILNLNFFVTNFLSKDSFRFFNLLCGIILS